MQFVPLGPEAVLQSWMARTKRLGDRTGGASQGYSSRNHAAAQRALRAIAPQELHLHHRSLNRAIEATAPDVVHALRIPFEGMAATSAWQGPVVASIWGNDLTLHAALNRGYRRSTTKALARVAGLQTDCHRDQRLAAELGFSTSRPTLVAPGSGGIQASEFRAGESALRRRLGIPADAPVILNARGVRRYTRVPEFLEALELLLIRRSDLHVLMTGMLGHERVEHRVRQMPGRDRVHLLPTLTHAEMPDVHRAADVAVSLTTHDGTPNTLLESMSTGVLPVVSPIESVLEWIDDGINGLVVSATDVSGIVSTILNAIDSPDLRASAASINQRLIRQRADRDTCRERILDFYYQVLSTQG